MASYRINCAVERRPNKGKNKMGRRKKTIDQLCTCGDIYEESHLTRFDASFRRNEDEVDIEKTIKDELSAHWKCLLELAQTGFKELGEGYVYINVNCRSFQIGWYLLDRATVWFVADKVGDVLSYDPETEVRFYVEFEDGEMSGVASMEQPQKAA